ncbi:MAG: AMP-binding protein, partial [Longimicrobiales bacterium]
MSAPSQTATAAPSAHTDTFARDNLPPAELWPVMDYSVLPELAYPPRLNCAAELLDRHIAEDDGDRIALRFPGGHRTYRTLLETSSRIARVLAEDLGLEPGNRVLIRGPNNPMYAACWFGILKAGGICVATMPMLRARELAVLCDRARITLALTDARLAVELDKATKSTPALERIVRFNAADDADSLDALMRRKPDTFQNVD